MLVPFAFGRTASSAAGTWRGAHFSATVTVSFPRIVTTAPAARPLHRNRRAPSRHLATLPICDAPLFADRHPSQHLLENEALTCNRGIRSGSSQPPPPPGLS